MFFGLQLGMLLQASNKWLPCKYGLLYALHLKKKKLEKKKNYTVAFMVLLYFLPLKKKMFLFKTFKKIN